MTHGSLFVAPVPGTPPVGMSATDGRLALAGIFGLTAQLVQGGGVAQSGSNMQFTISASVWQLADVTNAAATFFAATDSTVLTPAAGPGSGSRKDLICVRAHNYENGDADSQAAVVLVAGTAGSPGVDPAVPAGYFKYAEIAVPTSAATAAACTVTIYANSTFAPPDLQATTLALLQLTTGVAGQTAVVTNDATTPTNNGQYLWGGAALGWVGVVPRIILQRVATPQSIPTGASTVITYDATDLVNKIGNAFSSPGSINRATGLLVCGIAGTYSIRARGDYAANATGIRQLFVDKALAASPSTFVSQSAAQPTTLTATSIPTNMVVVTEVSLAQGDVLRISTAQSSGGALNLTAHLEIEKVA